MPTPRPHVQRSTKELEEMAAGADHTTLKTIIHELGFRERKAAVQLLKQLQERLTGAATNSPPTTTAPPTPRRVAPAAAPAPPQQPKSRPTPREDSLTRAPQNSSSPSPKPTFIPTADPSTPSPPKREMVPGGIAPRRAGSKGVELRDDVPPAFAEVDDPFANICAALAVEVDAVRRAGSEQSIHLANGQRIESTADHHLYRFTCSEPPQIADDTPISIRIGQQIEEGSLVSIQGNTLIVSLSNDFGSGIASCQLQVDMSFLVETLRKRFEAIRQRLGGKATPATTSNAQAQRTNIRQQAAPGESSSKQDPATAIAAWDRGIPEILLGRTPTRADIDGPAWTNHGGLRIKQIEAVNAALRHPVTLVWGPPGTGKSTTVAALIAELLSRNARILVVSNTNLAVDGLLAKLAEQMAKSGNHEPLRVGNIVRHGVLSESVAPTPLAGLPGTLADYVSIEKIVARLSEDLMRRKSALIDTIARLEQDAAHALALRVAFQDLDRARADLEKVNGTLTASTSRLPTARSEAEKLPGKLETARRELSDHLQKGLIGKLFSGASETSLQEQIATIDQQLQDARRDAADLPKAITELRTRQDELSHRIQSLESRTASSTRSQVEARCTKLEADLKGPRAELTQVNQQLAAVQEAVLARCRCLFATATQVFLKPKNFSPSFDVVIIEEATMLLLPAAIYAAGLAKSQVVITGDYRQLPAIVAARDPASKRWLATDLFTLTGNADSSNGATPLAPKVTLTVQSRMVEPICDLINSVFYDGLLETATEPDPTIYPNPLGQICTIIDTSAEIPFVRTKPNTHSRYSLLHAHAIRNLCVQLINGGLKGKDIAIMSPYRAQVQILTKLLADVDSHIEVGTVHRFQGREARVVIFDICDSHGLPYLSHFIRPGDPAADGAKLLNVAVSRAKHRIVVVANLPFLHDQLPEEAILRDILHQMGTRGAIVPCATVFEARDMPLPFTAGFSPETRSVYRENDFEVAFLSDLSKAERYVVIQSAFFTPQRLAGWEQAFRALIARHVRIRIVTRPPETQGSIPPEQVLKAIELAERLGLIVDLRNMIHQKSAIIDGAVVWHGSLNILSFTYRSEESMYRIVSPPLAELEAQFDTVIRRKTREGARGDLADRENPPCPSCGSLSVLHPTSRYGAFLRCLDSTCGWKCSVDRLGQKSVGPIPVLKKPIACPSCGLPMKVRTGRTGHFLGCSGFPTCRKTKPLDGDDPEAEPTKRSSGRRTATR